MNASLDYSPDTRQKFSNLVDILRYRALNQPDKTAYTFLQNGETEGFSLTNQELDRQVRAIAAQLQSLGATGERALLLYSPGLEFIAAFFGCLYASVVAVPAFPPRPNRSMSRLQAIVTDAQPMVTLTTTSVLANLEGQLERYPELAVMRWLSTNDLKSSLKSDWQEVAVSSDTLALLQYTSGSTGKPKGVMVSHGNLLHNSAAIQKCFENTPNSRGVSWLPPYHDMGLIGGVVQPLYVGAPMILMSPVDFLQKPLRWLQAISRDKATTSGGPNFAYDLCVEKIKPEQLSCLDLSSWEVAFNGAEPVRSSTLERFAATFEPCGFRARAFHPCYGLAETTLIVSGGLKTRPPVVRSFDGAALEQNRVVAAAGEQENLREIVGCGQAWLDQKIAIAEPKSLTQCTDEQVGEIWVSGSSVAGGYWNRPEETEQTFRAYLADTGVSVAGRSIGPFIRTGDLGFLQDGELFVTGRLKDLIIIRGRNHYPQDIELTVCKSHPALHPSAGAAFALEVEGVERLVIAQEVERSYLRQLDVDEVVRAIRRAVSQQHELEVYAVVLLKTASIPKTSSGKIQRYACRIGFLNGSLDVVGDWTANHYQIDSLQLQADIESLVELQSSGQLPSDENESEVGSRSLKPTFTEEVIKDCLVAQLAMHLKVPPDEIDIGEPFASYGLDSSLAISLTDELEDWLGCELEPTLFWEYPSIEALAQYLATSEVSA